MVFSACAWFIYQVLVKKLCFKLFAYVFERQSYREEEMESDLPYAGLWLKYPQWPGAWNSESSHMHGRGHLLLLSWAPKQESELWAKQPAPKSALLGCQWSEPELNALCYNTEPPVRIQSDLLSVDNLLLFIYTIVSSLIIVPFFFWILHYLFYNVSLNGAIIKRN